MVCDIENRAALIQEIRDTWGFDIISLSCGYPDSSTPVIPDVVRFWLDTAKSIGLPVDSVSWAFPTVGDSCVEDSTSEISIFGTEGELTLRKFLDPSDESHLRDVANKLFARELSIDANGNILVEYDDLHYSLSLGGVLGEEVCVDYVVDSTVSSEDFGATYDMFKSL